MTTFDKSTTIGFIGAGSVGGSLAVALHNAGYPVVAVGSRTFASAERFASRIPGCAPYRSLQRLVDSVGFVFITTSDDAIGAVCDSLRWREGQGVAHCSGAASLEPLQSAVEGGAASGAFHPLQAFSSVEEGVQNIPGATFGIEAGPDLRDYLERMALDIGGNPIFLRPEDKVLYHISGVLMGNLLSVLASVAASVWPKFDHDRDEGIHALTPDDGRGGPKPGRPGSAAGRRRPISARRPGNDSQAPGSAEGERAGVSSAILRISACRSALRRGKRRAEARTCGGDSEDRQELSVNERTSLDMRRYQKCV